MAIMTQCLHIMGGITLLVTVVLANAIPAEVVARDFGTTAVDAMDVLAREPNEKRCEEKLCCRTGNIGTWGSFCEVRFGKAQPDSYQVDVSVAEKRHELMTFLTCTMKG
jgi:hypothetical protein